MLIESIQRLTKRGFFNRDESAQTAWEIVAWWETRRIPYNIIVGAVGIVSCGLCLTTALLTEHFQGEAFGLPDPPFFALFGVISYGIMANVCYTGGWIAELIARKLWPHEGVGFAKILFFFGLVFSILLTLASGALISGLGAVVLIQHALSK